MTTFMGTEWCGLCRGRFPLENCDWQSQFRAVLLLEDNVELSDVASIPAPGREVNVTLSGYGRTREIIISHCSHSIVYNLAHIFTSPFRLWETFHETRYEIDSIGTLQTLVGHVLRSKWPRLTKLPLEIAAHIWRELGLGTPLSTYILVTNEACRLVKYLQDRRDEKLILKLGSYLSIKTIEIFGTQYIQELAITEGYNSKDQVYQSGGQISTEVVNVKIVLGVAGICALKLVGSDWESSWLGTLPSKGQFWYGSIPDVASTLHCVYNALNCVALSKKSSSLILWDQLDIPPMMGDPELSLFNFERDSVQSLRNEQYFQFLPLKKDGERAGALTIYDNGNGIVGLESHFVRTSQLSRSRNGCALYFQFAPREVLMYAWLRAVDFESPAFSVPALIVQTSQGRVHCFGPYILPTLIHSGKYKWALLKGRGIIDGLYYNNSPSRKNIQHLGIISDGSSISRALLAPQYQVCDFPTFASPNFGLHLSTAILVDLDRVELCRIGDRCTGILIRYLTGSTTVLGQWHTSGNLQRSCIFNRAICLRQIAFKLATFGRYQLVTDITFLEVEEAARTQYRVFDLIEPIAWWFSRRYDEVWPWRGTSYDVPDTSTMIQ